MSHEDRQNRYRKTGQCLVAIGITVAVVGVVWRSQIRFAPLTEIDSATLEMTQIETPKARSDKRLAALMMIVGGAAAAAIGKVLTSESQF